MLVRAFDQPCGTGGRVLSRRGAAKAASCVGMFVGHQHEIAMSLYYEGFCLTYGLKTGVEAYHDPALIGTTKITISQEYNSFDVEYVFSDIKYPLSDGKIPQSP